MSEPLDDLDTYAARIEAMIARIEEERSEPARLVRPSPDAWSLTEIVQHLGLVSRGMLRTAHPATDAPDVGRHFETLVDRLRSDAKIVAPVPQIVPRPGVTWTDATTTVRAGIAAWREFLATGQLRAMTFTHALAGELTGPQTVRFLVEHFDHHAPQMERLLAT